MSKTYSYDEAIAASIQYFDGDELAAKVFVDKYALRNCDEYCELTPDDMHKRIAKEIYRIERKKHKNPLSEQEIYDLFKNFNRLVPQGSILYGCGNNDVYVSLSNCYSLLSPFDSYSSILNTDAELVNIAKRRGGSGVDLSTLRPCGAPTRNSSKTSTGVPSFMKRYGRSIGEVGMAGRRGALMMTLSVHHPDILGFINAKKEIGDITGANISVRLSNEFLNAVQSNTEYEQRWPVDDKTSPDISKLVNANEIWDAIIKNATNRSEPGLLFWDTIITESPPDCYPEFKTVCTNPCSEIPLSAYDSCRLLLLNIYSYVDNPFTKNAKFNFEKFSADVELAVRIMDDIIDLEIECVDRIIHKVEIDPEPDYIKESELRLWKNIKEICQNGRRTGIGQTGLGDTFAALGLKYGSKKSIEMVGDIMVVMKLSAYKASVDLAEKIGHFPVFDYAREANNPYLNRLKQESFSSGGLKLDGSSIYNKMKVVGRRNIALLTCSPAGSMSIMTQTTSGIEPLYEKSYVRRKKVNPNDKNVKIDSTDEDGNSFMHFEVAHPKIKVWEEIGDIPFPWVTANEINWEKRVELQAVMTRYIDHSISSTVNLPSTATIEDVKTIYETAWKSGCKGITVHREGARKDVISREYNIMVPTRPKELPAIVYHSTLKDKPFTILIGILNDKPFEIFLFKNGRMNNAIKSGKIIRKSKNTYKFVSEDESVEICPITALCSPEDETVGRLLSLALRLSFPLRNTYSEEEMLNLVAEQLEKVGASEDMYNGAKVVARVLRRYIKMDIKLNEPCPECGDKLVKRSSCDYCASCSWSRCI